MSLEGQNFPPENALENEQRFVLDTKEGLQKFHEFLVSEEGQIDALDPDLVIEDLALPEAVAASLKQLRLEYKDLVRLTNEALQGEAQELAEEFVANIANQYQVYVGADERFSAVYVAYETALENPALDTSDTQEVKKQSSKSVPEDVESTVESAQTSLEAAPSTQTEEGISQETSLLQEEISQEYASINKVCDTFQQKFPEGKRPPKVEEVSATLGGLQARASAVEQKATKNDELTPAPSADDLKNYVRSMERIHTSINSLVFSMDVEPAEHLVTEESAPPEGEQQSENESEQLKVCGLSLPEAGPSGVKTARSFRDDLETAKANHPDLKDNPENLAIANAISRVLFVVPAVGLTEAQVSRVAELVRELNLSEEVTETNERVTEEEGPVESGKEAEVEDWLVNENTKKRGAMKVELDSKDDGDVAITFAEKIADKVEKKIDLSDRSVTKAINFLTQSASGSSVVAEMEKQDSVNSINNTIPPKVARDSIKRERVPESSLTGTYLAGNALYQAFFQENDISQALFEKKLQKTIQSIDAKEIDYWESKFDKPYKSAFSHLQEMTLKEIAELNALAPVKRKNLLQAENVKYEAYIAWMDTYEEIIQTVTSQPTMKFEEIFVKGMVEAEMEDY